MERRRARKFRCIHSQEAVPSGNMLTSLPSRLRETPKRNEVLDYVRLCGGRLAGTRRDSCGTEADVSMGQASGLSQWLEVLGLPGMSERGPAVPMWNSSWDALLS